MLHRLLIASLLLSDAVGARRAAFGARGRAAPPALVPETTPGASAALAVRGGAAVGPVDPETAAKAFGALYLLTGVQHVLSPKSPVKMYGMEEASATGTNGKLLRRNGLAVLGLGLHAACLLFKGTDLNTSFGLASLPHAADALASLLNDDADTVGPSKVGDALILAFTAAASYAGLSNADWAPAAFKACAAFAIASGLPCFVDPKAAIGLWEVKGDDDLTPGVVSAVGSNLLVLGVLAASLAWGVDTVTAFGYAAATALVAGGYNNFVSEDFAKLGCNSNALAVYTLLFGAVAAVILL